MKKVKYLCSSIIFISLLIFSTSYAALCPLNGGKHVYSSATCTKPKTCDCGATSGTSLGHNYKSYVSSKTKVATEKNCLRIKTTYKCTRCATSYAKNTYDTTHNYSSTVTNQATCTSTGIITYKCKDCDYITTNTIEKKSHVYLDATCTAPAKCTVCGATKGSAKGHDYKVTITKAATCSEEGVAQYTCKVCNKSYTENLSKKAHTYLGASCTAPGKCTVCGATSGSAKGHDYKVTITKAATCSEEGVAQYTCKVCNKSYTEKLSKKAHTYSGASCTAPGKCTVCGATSGSAKGHTYSGYVSYSDSKHYIECNQCGYQLMTNHKIVNNACADCGYKITCLHTNKTKATCTEDGKCTNCGQIVEEALGHNYCDYIPNADYHIRFCSICGNDEKKSHKFEKNKILKEATCIAEGENQYKCNKCGYLKTESTQKVSHVYEGSAGYSSDAKYHYSHCKWCEAVNSKGVNHTWSNGICKVCNYVCKHSYETVNINGKIMLRCTLCKMYKENDTCDHEYNYVSDVYGHYYKCAKCKNIDKTKSGTHRYDSKYVDLCNGYHERRCITKGCNYVLKTPHVYVKGKCISCGSQNTTGIQSKVNVAGVSVDLSRKSEDSKALQEKLVNLGYNVGSIDGVVGDQTIKALNQLLADQGSSRKIGSKAEITPEVFQLLMICEETREEAQVRINQKQAEDLLKDLESQINSEQADEKERIQYAQIILQRLGYYPTSEGINGSANTITSDAIKIYCISNGIDVSDVNVKDMDFDFLKKLGSTTKTYAEVKQGKLAEIKSGKIDFDMSSENQRMEVQLMLKASGYYTGSINGELDSNTRKAIKQLCEDKGLCSSDMKDITDWNQITLEKFAIIAATDKKGLEEFKRSDENDKTFMGAVLDLKAYYASHGFKYCKDCGSNVRTVIPSNSTRGCSHKNGAYVTDCSTAVTAYLYYYAEANGSDTMMADFSGQLNSTSYVNAAKADGYINGVKYFEVVSVDEVQEGDILAVNGHVEIYAGSMADATYANVYNAGDDKYIANPSFDSSSSKHPLSGYKILRPISPYEVQKLDSSN